ncbi:probable NAD(P)H dehydrogenase (quinone) FQR1-like 2 isoform X4 [Cucumis melo]|uniref:Probable NAD(P)H dehydrogenase (Quinone) FQR1-like 2 isoform X4 n=1 Tax=Cucumis melo TaxID=3656 RepID=A0ABM3KC47_CUCME|nr:probable NAD(P)H dehydrogenase (quinone) FQR1-like 2 isoform X4 [Cucumis melo]
MGKGNGCVPSKNGPLVTVSDTNPIPIPIPIPDQLKSKAGEISRNLRIFIVYYSMYGHVDLLAKRMKKGVDSVDGVEGVLFKVPETLPLETLEQMRVPVKDDGVPVISVEEMVEADGFLFGFPTRLTAVSVLAYHGMVYVPIGYTFGSEMSNLESIRGGSPYGAGVFSGNGSRPLSSIELDLAHHQDIEE